MVEARADEKRGVAMALEIIVFDLLQGEPHLQGEEGKSRVEVSILGQRPRTLLHKLHHRLLAGKVLCLAQERLPFKLVGEVIHHNSVSVALRCVIRYCTTLSVSKGQVVGRL